MRNLIRYFRLNKDDKFNYNKMKEYENNLLPYVSDGSLSSITVFAIAYEYIILGFHQKGIALLEEYYPKKNFSQLYAVMENDENHRAIVTVCLCIIEGVPSFKDNYFFKIFLVDIKRKPLGFPLNPMYHVPSIINAYSIFYGSVTIEIKK